ncbi:MAG: glucokinase [Woeseiaceae bacterium]
MADNSLLIGDIGGTNARFALAQRDQPGFSDAMTVPCADFESAHSAIDFYLDAKHATPPGIICLAAAGPVVAQTIRFTNNHWNLAVDDLLADFSGAQVRLLNDFEAIAYSVPHLQKNDYMQIGLPDKGPLPADNFTVGIMGPGTGLGAVGLKVVNGSSVPIAGEAGHIGFAPASQVQIEILAVLREHYDRVSSERLVCGAGIENIHWALGRVHGQDWPQRSAKEIFAAATHNEDGRASEAVHMFFEILGQVAGDFALAIGANDGIFIAGGIVPRHPDLFANSGFRAGFENKGRYRSMMENIPTRLIQHAYPGLLGAAVVAAEMAEA